MKKYTIKRYEHSDYSNWNTFVTEAKNATFLFHRDFMDYHQDRFQDHSLIVFEGQKWIAILPANSCEKTLYSHQGLTYGGLVYSDKIKLATVIELFKEILFYLTTNSFEKLQIKTLPSVYHHKPAEELNYVLFLLDAKLIRRDTLAVLDLSKNNIFSAIRKRGVKRGIKNNLMVREVDGFDDFWNAILTPNLNSKFNLKPVHSIQEIALLKQYFPKNIRQFNVYHNESIVAGTTIFETKSVVHCQYISTLESNYDLGGLDFLFHHLITEVFKHKQYFDFGNSNENLGKNLNSGLSYWKESFGASTIVHDYYQVDTINYNRLENILI